MGITRITDNNDTRIEDEIYGVIEPLIASVVSEQRKTKRMRWGTWLLIGFIFVIDVSIFINSFLSQYLKRKKNEKVKYGIGGIILTIIITIYLLVSIILKILGEMPDA